MKDRTLEEKLAKLTEAGDKMQAVRASISEKQGLIDNLKSNQPKFAGLPAVSALVEETIARLEAETADEKELLAKIQADVAAS